MRKLTTEEFVARARGLLGDSYDYSLVQYSGVSKLVTLICTNHGKFNKRASDILKGQGCPICGELGGAKKRNSAARAKFLRLAKELHAGKGYDYSSTVYVDGRTKVKIHCAAHGDFWQLPHAHTKGAGCPDCDSERKFARGADTRKKAANEFSLKASKVHGDTYLYHLVDYERATSPVSIVCRVHGEFCQTPQTHLAGGGCQKWFP